METLSENGKIARRDYMKDRRNKLSPEALKKQREYLKAWRKKNAERVKLYLVEYWEKKARESTNQGIMAHPAPVTVNITDKIPVTIKGNTCLQCHCNFNAKRSDSKFCSPACKMKFHRAKENR